LRLQNQVFCYAFWMLHLAVQAQTQLELLGSGGLRLSGTAQKLPTKKLLCLLAYLALEGATSRSRLADLLWSDCTSTDARRNLRRELHRLRQLGLLAVLTGDEVLALTPPFSVDVLEAVQLFEAGHLETALERSQAELLEGMFLPEADGFSAWLEDKRAWLQKMQTAALLELSERAETRGDWAEALVWQQQLLALEPLFERTHQQVMRLLYLLGRREDALRQFGRCQQLLQAELGLEPLPETRLLAERIRSAQGLFPTEPSPSQALDLVVPLVGRAELLQTVLGSRASLCVLVGLAGVGKSRLLEALDEVLGGAWCLRFTPAMQATPFAALAALIRGAWQHPEHSLRLSALETIWQQEAARLVPELRPQHTPPPAQADERSKFLEGLCRTLQAVLGESGVLLVDDLHCADAASLEWLAYLLGRFGLGLRVVAATRPPEAELEVWLGKLPNFERVIVAGLPHSETQTLLCHLAGEVSPGLVQQLKDNTEGNPFFLLETWRFLQAGGHLEQQNGAWVAKHLPLPLPPTVLATVLQRVAQQGMAAQRLLETAALCADAFVPNQLLPATALGEWEALQALEVVLGAGLVVRLGGGYALAHDLIRSALVQALSPERQRLIHHKLAGTLERHKHSPERIAWHLEQAGSPEKAVVKRLKAAKQALEVFAYQTALDQHRLAAQHSPPKAAFDLYCAMLEWHQNLGQPDIWQRDLEGLEALAQTLGAVAQTEALLARAQYHIWHAEDALALEYTTTVLARADLSPQQHATALENHGYLLANFGQLEQSNAVRHEALVLLPKSSKLRGKVYYGLMMNAYKLGQFNQALEWVAKAKIDFEAHQVVGFLVNLHIMQGVVFAMLGQEQSAIVALEFARCEAKRILHPYRWVAALLNLFELYFEAGQMPQAREVLLEVRQAQPHFTDPFTEGAYWRCQSQVAWFDGNAANALELATRALALDEQSAAVEHLVLGRLTLAKLKRETGDLNTAQDLLLEVQHLLQNSSLALHTLQYHLEWAELELALGKPDAALVWLGQPGLDGTTAQKALVQLASIRAHWQKQAKKKAKTLLAALEETSSLEVRLQKLLLQLEFAPKQSLLEQARRLLGQELPAKRRAALEAAFQNA
jgi:DNA-binding SARP family transcriptional activator